jgi:hypothetical protein
MKKLILILTLLITVTSYAKSDISSKLQGSHWKLTKQIVGKSEKRPRFTRLPEDFPDSGYFLEIVEFQGNIRNYFPTEIQFLTASKVSYMTANVDLLYSINESKSEISIVDEIKEFGDKAAKETRYKIKLSNHGKSMKLTAEIGGGEFMIYKFELLN